MLETAVVWAALSFALAALVALAKVYAYLTGKIEKGEEAHATQIAALQGQLSMFRERVAADYVTREVLEKFEDRVVSRLESAIEHLGERLDQAILNRAKK